MLRDRLVCGIRDAEIAEQKARDIQKLPSAEEQQLLHDIGKVSLTACSCYSCGDAHTADKCLFKDSECHHCHKKGHIAKVCRSKAKQQLPSDQAKSRSQRTENTLQVTEEQTEDTAEAVYGMFALQDPKQSSKVAPTNVTVLARGANLVMEVDTGASTLIIIETTYWNTWPTKQAPSQCSTTT